MRAADTTAATLFITNLNINRERAIVSHPHFDAVPTRAVLAAGGVRDLHASVHVAARGREPGTAIPDSTEARRRSAHARTALRLHAARAFALRLRRAGGEAGRAVSDEHARAPRLTRRVTRAPGRRAREAAEVRVRRAHVEGVSARVVAHGGAAARAAVGVAHAGRAAVNPGAPPVDAERGGRAGLGAATDHPARRPRGPREVDAHPTSGCGRELRARGRRPHRRGAPVARATRRTTPTIVGRATDGLLPRRTVGAIAGARRTRVEAHGEREGHDETEETTEHAHDGPYRARRVPERQLAPSYRATTPTSASHASRSARARSAMAA